MSDSKFKIDNGLAVTGNTTDFHTNVKAFANTEFIGTNKSNNSIISNANVNILTSNTLTSNTANVNILTSNTLTSNTANVNILTSNTLTSNTANLNILTSNTANLNNIESSGNSTFTTVKFFSNGSIVGEDGNRPDLTIRNLNISGNVVSSQPLTPGFTGSRGAVGFTGSIGFTGSQGIPGQAASTGFTGSKGDQGNIGFTGSVGIGFTGSKGDIGNIGFNGFTGSRGIIGFTGSKGSDGINGFTGSKGDIGNIGFTGSSGNPFNGGTFTGIADFNEIIKINKSAITLENQIIKVLYPKGSSKFFIGNNTGAIKIKLPLFYTNTLVKIDISLNVSTPANHSSLLTVYGYNTNDGGGSVNWIYTHAYLTSGPSSPLYTIRFGDDGDKCCIWVGDISNLWVDLSAKIESFSGSYLGLGEEWSNNWDISIVNTFNTVKETLVSERGGIGYTGSQGFVGFTGSKGDIGGIGFAGSKGDQGTIGFVGSQGFVGFTGSQGSTSLPKSLNTTLALADVGKYVEATGTITIPNTIFSSGDIVSILNTSSSPISIIASITTLRLSGTTSVGNRSLAGYGIATVLFNSSSLAFISGAGVS